MLIYLFNNIQFVNTKKKKILTLFLFYWKSRFHYKCSFFSNNFSLFTFLGTHLFQYIYIKMFYGHILMKSFALTFNPITPIWRLGTKHVFLFQIYCVIDCKAHQAE